MKEKNNIFMVFLKILENFYLANCFFTLARNINKSQKVYFGILLFYFYFYFFCNVIFMEIDLSGAPELVLKTPYKYFIVEPDSHISKLVALRDNPEGKREFVNIVCSCNCYDVIFYIKFFSIFAPDMVTTEFDKETLALVDGLCEQIRINYKRKQLYRVFLTRQEINLLMKIYKRHFSSPNAVQSKFYFFKEEYNSIHPETAREVMRLREAERYPRRFMLEFLFKFESEVYNSLFYLWNPDWGFSHKKLLKASIKPEFREYVKIGKDLGHLKVLKTSLGNYLQLKICAHHVFDAVFYLTLINEIPGLERLVEGCEEVVKKLPSSISSYNNYRPGPGQISKYIYLNLEDVKVLHNWKANFSLNLCKTLTEEEKKLLEDYGIPENLDTNSDTRENILKKLEIKSPVLLYYYIYWEYTEPCTETFGEIDNPKITFRFDSLFE